MTNRISELADRLADIRAEIRTLRAIEDDLRQALLVNPGQREGVHFIAIAEAKRMRRFEPKLLPKAVYQDPRYWQSRVTQVVRVLPKDAEGVRPDRGARHAMPTGQACTAGAPLPPHVAVRHNVPPSVPLDDLGPQHYRMADDFWDRLS